MINRLALVFAILASPALAKPVEVTSGEHDGFTRIVLNFQAETDWEFGRVLDGYRFRPIGTSAEYDLKPVFNRIGKSRLAAISSDRETGGLDIGFACACHAIPFEFRPGIIVIDLRDGPPPKGSSFENLLLEQAAAQQQVEDAPQPQGQTLSQNASYNWLQQRGAPATTTTKTPISMLPSPESFAPLPSSAPNLQPLRDQLLRQLSRGASQGVIDLAAPKSTGEIPPKAEVEAARVALGEMGGVVSKTARMPSAPLGAQGAVCLPDTVLNIADWGNSDPTTEQLILDMPALVGEFDAPIPEAVTRAVRTRLFLGFGVEARLILQAFPAAATDEAVLLALSYLVDGESDPTIQFKGQGRCSTAAALWAGLSDATITNTSQIDSKPVILAFSALPEHLRRHIGPQLIDRFLALKDEHTATSLRNMILRASDESDSRIDVATAKIDLAKGHPAAAEAHLQGSETGANFTSADSLITRVKARIAQGLPVDGQTATALSSLQSEMRDTEIGPEIAKALIYAQAASGDFQAAFAALDEYPDEAAVVWRALAGLAEDSAFLGHTIPAPEVAPKGFDSTTITTIATRLLDLGFADAALNWMKLGGAGQGQLLAQIHLARRDGKNAVLALEGDATAQAALLRAAALDLLGEYASAADTLAPIAPEAQTFALARAKDWSALAKGDAKDWAALAQDLAPPATEPAQVDTFGPLARGLSLTEDSAKTRSEIESLLSSLPSRKE